MVEVSIDVWKQPWFRLATNSCIQSATYLGMETLKVKDLVDHLSGGWNVPLINNLFEPHDAQAILQSRDKRIWAPTRNGIIRLREHIN